MRSLSVTAFLLFAACGAGDTTPPVAAPSHAPVEPTPAPTPAPAPAPAEELGECHLRCCNEETLALQRRTAIEMNDPSIEHECCFCGPEPEPPDP